MRLVKLLTWVSLGLAAVILIVGCLLIGYWHLALLTVAWLMLWGWGVHRKRQWLVTASLTGFCLELAAGEWLGLRMGWSVIGIVLVLVAWDLQWFAWRIMKAEQIIGEKEMVQSHLIRIVVLVSAGMILAGTAMSIHIEFSIGVAILLGLLVVLGLRQWLLIAKRSIS